MKVDEPHTADGAVFDRECAKCKHLFECQGKPKEVKKFINFEERNGKGEKRRSRTNFI